MSIHHELMRLGRRSLRDNAGRPVTHLSSDGIRTEGILARYTSAETVTVDTDTGPEARRELVVQVEIGTGDGRLPKVEVDGAFLIDVDDTGAPAAWTIESFPNSDGGWKRCLCVVKRKQGGRAGMPRPRS